MLYLNLLKLTQLKKNKPIITIGLFFLSLFFISIVHADISFSVAPVIDKSDKVIINESENTLPAQIPNTNQLMTNKSRSRNSMAKVQSLANKKQRKPRTIIESKHSDFKSIRNTTMRHHKIQDTRKVKTERVEGYVTVSDSEGNETTDYVYGELQKSKSGTSGHLYGDKGKSFYVYGHDSEGSLHIEKDTGTVIIDDKKLKKKKKAEFSDDI